MREWKPLIIRTAIFFALLYLAVPAAIKLIGTKPQIKIIDLDVPLFFIIAGMFLVFTILNRDKLRIFPYELSWKQGFLFTLFAYSTFVIYIIQQHMYFGEHHILFLTTGWALYFLASCLLFMAVFNTYFVKEFFKPILASIGIAIGYYVGGLLLNMTAHPLTRVLSIPLGFLLSLTNEVTVSFVPGPAPTVSAGQLSAVIGPPCTGITSLLLFTGLFLFVLLLDWKKINKKAAITIYIIGAIGMFLVAFIRLYVLFLVGANWSLDLALNGFHTNAGWILFVAYFLIYFYFTYPRMKNE